MSFKEVKELRKSGNLNEALIMAQQDLENDTTNIWNKRSLGWVYYDYMKDNATVEKFSGFKEYLEKLKALDLPADEQMIYDNCSYQIGKILFSIGSSEPIDYRKINDLFELIRDFHFSKPSESYTFLLKAFHKSYKNWANYLDFADWWGFDNLRPEDYLAEEYNGNKVMSIAEQAYIAYSKKLEVPTVDSDGDPRHFLIDRQKIELFLPQLDALIESHPEYQYPAYFKAKLLLCLGDNDNVLSSFIPFAKKKRNDFWVWELMSEVFPIDDERKFACLCKALSLKTPDGFLINTRQKLAEILIKLGKFKEAKTEIEKIISARNDNTWKIPRQIENWSEQPWFPTTESFKTNHELYKQYLVIAEELLYNDIPEEIVVIEFVNSNKFMLNFVKDKDKHGFFSYKGLVETPKIGDILRVRFIGEASEDFHKVLSIKKVDEPSDCSALKMFQGKVRLVASAGIGFVENIFIGKDIVLNMGLIEGQELKGKAILSFNKSKNDWGWKAIKISID